ncbi:hypothetical protein Tco_0658994 [Tanacetum coccineum]
MVGCVPDLNDGLKLYLGTPEKCPLGPPCYSGALTCVWPPLSILTLDNPIDHLADNNMVLGPEGLVGFWALHFAVKARELGDWGNWEESSVSSKEMNGWRGVQSRSHVIPVSSRFNMPIGSIGVNMALRMEPYCKDSFEEGEALSSISIKIGHVNAFAITQLQEIAYLVSSSEDQKPPAAAFGEDRVFMENRLSERRKMCHGEIPEIFVGEIRVKRGKGLAG